MFSIVWLISWCFILHLRICWFFLLFFVTIHIYQASTEKEQYNRIAEKKMSIPVEVLCKHFPTEFSTYINYTRALRFDDVPDYSYLRRLFRDLFFRLKYSADYKWDWILLGYDYKHSFKLKKGQQPLNPKTEQKAQTILVCWFVFYCVACCQFFG